MIQEHYITPEQAVALKAAGFPQIVRNDGLCSYPYYTDKQNIKYVMPTLALVQEWLEREHNIWIDTETDVKDGEHDVWDTVYFYKYIFGKNGFIIGNDGKHGPYDERWKALSAGIDHALSLEKPIGLK